MSFQLLLLLKYPREVLNIAPPLPLKFEDGAQIKSEIGRIGFYFDEWDAPSPNREGEPSVTIDSFFAHLVTSACPQEFDLALTTDCHPYASALYLSRPQENPVIRRCPESIQESDTPRLLADHQKVETRRQKLRHQSASLAGQMCDQLFTDPILGPYLKQVGEQIRGAISNFLTILKVEYGQYLIPGTLPVTTARNHWILPTGVVRNVSDTFLNRLLRLRSWTDPGDINSLIKPHHWPEITSRLEVSNQPPFSDVLLASAKGECDPDLGNPRLALIEAVAALEAEVKKLMTHKLQVYSISRSAIDRIVRETPLADLASVWIRRELGKRAVEVDQALYSLCVEAIHERNELMHHERRNLSAERALKHVVALGKLTKLAREVRESGTVRLDQIT